MTNDSLTCVVPTHNRPHFLRRLLHLYSQFSPGFPFLVVDSSKFGKMKPAYFAQLDEFDGAFTDPSIDPEQSRTLKDNGVALL